MVLIKILIVTITNNIIRMATNKRKASLKEIDAYLNLLGATANSINKLKVDIDKSMNLVDIDTNEIVFNFDVLPTEKKLALVPDYKEDENEFQSVEEPAPAPEDENEFQDVGDKPIFVEMWQPSKGEQKTLIWLGAGRTLKSKRGATKTWLFYDPSANDYLLIPQWSCMKYFEGNEAQKDYRYLITYLGLVTPKDGNEFHSTRIAKGKKADLKISHDWERLLADFEHN